MATNKYTLYLCQSSLPQLTPGCRPSVACRCGTALRATRAVIHGGLDVRGCLAHMNAKAGQCCHHFAVALSLSPFLSPPHSPSFWPLSYTMDSFTSELRFRDRFHEVLVQPLAFLEAVGRPLPFVLLLSTYSIPLGPPSLSPYNLAWFSAEYRGREGEDMFDIN